MRMRKILASIAIGFLISGCTHAPAGPTRDQTFNQEMNEWIGLSEEELLRDWHAPDSVYESGKLKFLTYSISRQASGGGAMIGRVFVSKSQTHYCDIEFMLNGGLIEQWNFKGDNCRYRKLKNIPASTPST
jgi:hypothetical protein